MQRVGFHFLIGAEGDDAIFGFGLEVVLEGGFGDEEFGDFVVSEAAGPDDGIPFFFGVFWIVEGLHSKPMSAFFLRHFSTSSYSFFLTELMSFSLR